MTTRRMQSSTGIQQDDPSGPAQFFLGVDQVSRTVESEFNDWYFNDSIHRDITEKVLHEVQRLNNQLQAVGRKSNKQKHRECTQFPLVAL